jgi:cleavage and polyadenylation specificity factor subunit 4
MLTDIDERSLIFDFEKRFPNFEFDETANLQTTVINVNGESVPGEICKFFLKGTCTKGTSCPFKHSKVDKAVVCKHWLRGLCKKGDFCEFLHEYDLSKMPECYFYAKYGECSNPECLYLHIKPEDKMKECPWYARGFCKHGPNCRHKHVKRTACGNYLLGFCPEGPECKLGHPKYELPKDEENPNKKARTPMICRKCGSIGHKASSCPKLQKENTKEQRAAPRPLETVTCFKCGQMGHYANHCTSKAPRQSQQNQQSSFSQGSPPPSQRYPAQIPV